MKMLLKKEEVCPVKPLSIDANGSLNITQTLIDICGFVRGHESIGEGVFLDKYLQPALTQLGVEYFKDNFGNIYVDSTSKVLYAAHVDTTQQKNKPNIKQSLVINGNTLGVKRGEGNVLGADDAVGIVVILWLLSNKVDIGAVFLRGEEVGLKGATYAATNSFSWLSKFDMCIEVDRAGTEEVITHQSPGRCASDQYAENLATQLGMGHEPSPNGVYTDNSMFDMIPECVNLAAGYVNQHSENETCNMGYIVSLCKSLLDVDYSLLGSHRTEGDDVDGWEDSGWDYDLSNDVPFSTVEEAETYVLDNIEAVALFLYMNYTTPVDIDKTYDKVL
jgi:hypothetical protein